MLKILLADLNDQDLKDLGVPLGHRKKLLKAIAALTPADEIALPPPAGATHAERRHLTVMFCDLVGSTQLSPQLDPENMQRGDPILSGMLHRGGRALGGLIAKYMGDGILVYFGCPRAHEDDAERAMRAGLDIVAVGAPSSSLG